MIRRAPHAVHAGGSDREESERIAHAIGIGAENVDQACGTAPLDAEPSALVAPSSIDRMTL